MRLRSIPSLLRSAIQVNQDHTRNDVNKGFSSVSAGITLQPSNKTIHIRTRSLSANSVAFSKVSVNHYFHKKVKSINKARSVSEGPSSNLSTNSCDKYSNHDIYNKVWESKKRFSMASNNFFFLSNSQDGRTNSDKIVHDWPGDLLINWNNKMKNSFDNALKNKVNIPSSFSGVLSTKHFLLDKSQDQNEISSFQHYTGSLYKKSKVEKIKKKKIILKSNFVCDNFKMKDKINNLNGTDNLNENFNFINNTNENTLSATTYLKGESISPEKFVIEDDTDCCTDAFKSFSKSDEENILLSIKNKEVSEIYDCVSKEPSDQMNSFENNLQFRDKLNEADMKPICTNNSQYLKHNEPITDNSIELDNQSLKNKKTMISEQKNKIAINKKLVGKSNFSNLNDKFALYSHFANDRINIYKYDISSGKKKNSSVCCCNIPSDNFNSVKKCLNLSSKMSASSNFENSSTVKECIKIRKVRCEKTALLKHKRSPLNADGKVCLNYEKVLSEASNGNCLFSADVNSAFNLINLNNKLTDHIIEKGEHEQMATSKPGETKNVSMLFFNHTIENLEVISLGKNIDSAPSNQIEEVNKNVMFGPKKLEPLNLSEGVNDSDAPVENKNLERQCSVNSIKNDTNTSKVQELDFLCNQDSKHLFQETTVNNKTCENSKKENLSDDIGVSKQNCSLFFSDESLNTVGEINKTSTEYIKQNSNPNKLVAGNIEQTDISSKKNFNKYCDSRAMKNDSDLSDEVNTKMFLNSKFSSENDSKKNNSKLHKDDYNQDQQTLTKNLSSNNSFLDDFELKFDDDSNNDRRELKYKTKESMPYINVPQFNHSTYDMSLLSDTKLSSDNNENPVIKCVFAPLTDVSFINSMEKSISLSLELNKSKKISPSHYNEMKTVNKNADPAKSKCHSVKKLKWFSNSVKTGNSFENRDDVVSKNEISFSVPSNEKVLNMVSDPSKILSVSNQKADFESEKLVSNLNLSKNKEEKVVKQYCKVRADSFRCTSADKVLINNFDSEQNPNDKVNLLMSDINNRKFFKKLSKRILLSNTTKYQTNARSVRSFRKKSSFVKSHNPKNNKHSEKNCLKTFSNSNEYKCNRNIASDSNNNSENSHTVMPYQSNVLIDPHIWKYVLLFHGDSLQVKTDQDINDFKENTDVSKRSTLDLFRSIDKSTVIIQKDFYTKEKILRKIKEEEDNLKKTIPINKTIKASDNNIGRAVSGGPLENDFKSSQNLSSIKTIPLYEDKTYNSQETNENSDVYTFVTESSKQIPFLDKPSGNSFFDSDISNAQESYTNQIFGFNEIPSKAFEPHTSDVKDKRGYDSDFITNSLSSINNMETNREDFIIYQSRDILKNIVVYSSLHQPECLQQKLNSNGNENHNINNNLMLNSDKTKGESKINSTDSKQNLDLTKKNTGASEDQVYKSLSSKDDKKVLHDKSSSETSILKSDSKITENEFIKINSLENKDKPILRVKNGNKTVNNGKNYDKGVKTRVSTVCDKNLSIDKNLAKCNTSDISEGESKTKLSKNDPQLTYCKENNFEHTNEYMATNNKESSNKKEGKLDSHSNHGSVTNNQYFQALGGTTIAVKLNNDDDLGTNGKTGMASTSQSVIDDKYLNSSCKADLNRTGKKEATSTKTNLNSKFEKSSFKNSNEANVKTNFNSASEIGLDRPDCESKSLTKHSFKIQPLFTNTDPVDQKSNDEGSEAFSNFKRANSNSNSSSLTAGSNLELKDTKNANTADVSTEITAENMINSKKDNFKTFLDSESNKLISKNDSASISKLNLKEKNVGKQNCAFNNTGMDKSQQGSLSRSSDSNWKMNENIGETGEKNNQSKVLDLSVENISSDVSEDNNLINLKDKTPEQSNYFNKDLNFFKSDANKDVTTQKNQLNKNSYLMIDGNPGYGSNEQKSTDPIPLNQSITTTSINLKMFDSKTEVSIAQNSNKFEPGETVPSIVKTFFQVSGCSDKMKDQERIVQAAKEKLMGVKKINIDRVSGKNIVNTDTKKVVPPLETFSHVPSNSYSAINCSKRDSVAEGANAKKEYESSSVTSAGPFNNINPVVNVSQDYPVINIQLQLAGKSFPINQGIKSEDTFKPKVVPINTNESYEDTVEKMRKKFIANTFRPDSNVAVNKLKMKSDDVKPQKMFHDAEKDCEEKKQKPDNYEVKSFDYDPNSNPLNEKDLKLLENYFYSKNSPSKKNTMHKNTKKLNNKYSLGKNKGGIKKFKVDQPNQVTDSVSKFKEMIEKYANENYMELSQYTFSVMSPSEFSNANRPSPFKASPVSNVSEATIASFNLLNNNKTEKLCCKPNHGIINIDLLANPILKEKYASVPSVSRILNETMSKSSKQALENWKSRLIKIMGEAKFLEFYQGQLDQGKNFHELVKDYLMGKTESNEKNKDNPCIKSIEWILKDITDVVAVESFVVHPSLGYKGIFDCIAVYKNKPVLIEWKHSARRKSNLNATYDAPLQMTAYMGALSQDMNYNFQVDRGLIVVAHTDGSPAELFEMDLTECQKYWSQWLKRLGQYVSSVRLGVPPT